jgi:hypothetical protein
MLGRELSVKVAELLGGLWAVGVDPAGDKPFKVTVWALPTAPNITAKRQIWANSLRMSYLPTFQVSFCETSAPHNLTEGVLPYCLANGSKHSGSVNFLI